MNGNPEIDNYLSEGCGRCPLGGTPDCKVHFWPNELVRLRGILLDCGLTEELKWSVPCYTFQGKNIALLSALKDFCAISFFKGSLLEDSQKLLESPGPNSQAARYAKFTNLDSIEKVEQDLKAYIFEAIEVEKAGLKVPFVKNPEPVPEELQAKFDEDPVFKSAFESLTPGRQRGYIIHFSQPKQSKTRTTRIEKWTPKILSGEGMHDEYRSRNRRN